MKSYIALTSKGIESLLQDEIERLGGEIDKTSLGSVEFRAELDVAFKVVLRTRLATRVMQKIATVDSVENKDELVASLKNKINWSKFLNERSTFSTEFVGKNKLVQNSLFGGLLIKDAIVDFFRDKCGSRPNVDKERAEYVFQGRLIQNKLHIYRDFSGNALSQRGYRVAQGKAPLKENLAAALVIRSGWINDMSQPLIDPCCGSGTILIEAALMAANIFPGYLRVDEYAFERFPDFDEQAFQQEKQAIFDLADTKAIDNIQIIGTDINSHVLDKARKNASVADVAQYIEFNVADAADTNNVYGDSGTILSNLPYGERLGDLPQLIHLHAYLGLNLKRNFKGWNVSLFTSNLDVLRSVKLGKQKEYKLSNGPLDCVLTNYYLDERQVTLKPYAEELPIYFEESLSFANRVKKNLKPVRKWAKSEGIECYRVYDGDIPEYNFAIDVYADHLVINEYAPPKTVDMDKARKRLEDALLIAVNILDVDINKVSLKVRQKQKGSHQYTAIDKRDERFAVKEYNAEFWVNIYDYLDTGLFLDHRITRHKLQKMAEGKHVLNLFCYTATASVHMALGGAKSVTSVDMSKKYLDWGKDNFKLNRLYSKNYQFVQANCLEYIEKANEFFDLIFIDPPTFSNSKRMEDSLDIQRDHLEILLTLKKRLMAGGAIIFSNNKRNFKMDITALQDAGFNVKEITKQTIPLDYKRNHKIHNCWELTV
ncbi:bifunctional 23S rRNA (guanine(2069)-N(7))-methyltransferase RlmK/23S rRNA (guanine(2445)-N(2))-methyltransferase RlmL [Flocculibacter collagenilyticus]|uniref:bifunctional 23S rRNA (guanine(2069)-N(7))-methyltransferase RlmK/23S rRNA (guanine(2445)-N(2))-methyltransferase RlmL n=1 Tax=Flocculibacter collagenilyticus TaxID=2744479 RepID=UPI0018F3C0FC|nr:bifunctional 23S rRNA (guanine(2069)-N(7))-methyltransferase RlmK/23S rRNA (guanine(2445)-N(2))-methyltransferase RlmL [Flocculibacter collagenilyticus]